MRIVYGIKIVLVIVMDYICCRCNLSILLAYIYSLLNINTDHLLKSEV